MFNEHDHDDFRIECVDTLNYVFESLLGYKTITKQKWELKQYFKRSQNLIYEIKLLSKGK